MPQLLWLCDNDTFELCLAVHCLLCLDHTSIAPLRLFPLTARYQHLCFLKTWRICNCIRFVLVGTTSWYVIEKVMMIIKQVLKFMKLWLGITHNRCMQWKLGIKQWVLECLLHYLLNKYYKKQSKEFSHFRALLQILQAYTKDILY